MTIATITQSLNSSTQALVEIADKLLKIGANATEFQKSQNEAIKCKYRFKRKTNFVGCGFKPFKMSLTAFNKLDYQIETDFWTDNCRRL